MICESAGSRGAHGAEGRSGFALVMPCQRLAAPHVERASGEDPALVLRHENPETVCNSSRERLAGVGPAKRLGQGVVEVVDEGGEFALEVINGGEVAAADDFAREDGEPHLDLVEPRGMLGREVEDDAVAGVAQEAHARGHRLEDAVLAFDAEVAVDAAGRGDQAHDGLRAVDVEIVQDQVPMGVVVALCEQFGQVLREVLLGAARADAVGDLAGDDIERGDQGQGTVADVLVLAQLGPAGAHRQGGRGTLQGLHAGHLVDAARLDAGGGASGREPIGFADVLAFLVELLIARRVEPTADAVRLEIGLAQETPYGARRNALGDAAGDGFRGQLGLCPTVQLKPVAPRRLACQRQDRAELLGRERRRRAGARRNH